MHPTLLLSTTTLTFLSLFLFLSLQPFLSQSHFLSLPPLSFSPPTLNSTSQNPINPTAPKTIKPTTKSFPQLPSLLDNPNQQIPFKTSPSQSNPDPNLDGPKLSEITPSTFDWWYFDAVSTKNPNVSVVFTFFSASQVAFPWLLAGADRTGLSALSAYLWVTFGNGSVSTKVVPARVGTVVSGGYGSSGDWEGSGFGWSGTEDAGRWVVGVGSDSGGGDGVSSGVKGGMVIDSTAPAQLPCALPKPDTEQSYELSPGVGWVNVVPDGNATVSLEVDGELIEFQGPAYHDKNWSNRPFFSTVSSWYWGHGHIGPYSIVWFNSMNRNNETTVSSYVTKNGKVLVTSCDSKVMTVRPTGESEEGRNGLEEEGRYPPRAGDYPAGFRVEVDLGDEEGGVLRVNVTARVVLVSDARYYVRWTGMMDGVVGGSVYRGVGVYEQFVLDEF